MCALHPAGPLEINNCVDFAPWPEGQIFWAPVGVDFNEVSQPADALVPLPFSLWSPREKLEKIRTHLLFSGHCPQCGHRLGYDPRYLWDCDRCGWQDDRVE